MKFSVSSHVDLLAQRGTVIPDDQDTSLAYPDEGGETRSLKIDLVVYNEARRWIRAYECKRGSSYHDAGKQRSIWRDLACTKLLLKNYGRRQDLDVDSFCVRAIYYYGREGFFERPWLLLGSELGDHFEVGVYQQIEEANEYFRTELRSLLSDIEDL